MEKKTINQAREEALWQLMRNPNGAKEIATAAISCMSWRSIKKLCEALDIEEKAKQIQKSN